MDVTRTGYVPVPKDVLIEIFKRIPEKDLPNCSRVCKGWFNAVNEIWRRSLLALQRFDVIDDFSPLVADRALSWRTAAKLAPLSEFCARSFSDNRTSIRHGNYTFTIVNSDDTSSIEVKINGKVEIVRTISESKELQCRGLAVDNNFLYILLNNGAIYQTSYRKNMEFVQEIPTAYSNRDPQLASYWNRKHCWSTEFNVKDGCIVVMWGPFSDESGGEIWTCESQCEIINLANGKRKLIQNLKKPLLIKNNKLFSLVRTYDRSPKGSSKHCYLQVEVDLATMQETRKLLIVDNHIWKYDVQNNMICATTSNTYDLSNNIIFIDTVSGKTRKSFNYAPPECITSLNNMVVIGNCCIRFFGSIDYKPILEIIDLKNKKTCIIRDCYDVENKTIKSAVLRNLVRLCINIQSTQTKPSFLKRLFTKK